MPDSPVAVMQTIPKERRTIPQRIGVFLFRYGMGLLMDEKSPGIWTISLGRVMTVALIVQAMIGWSRGSDTLDGQEHILIAVLAYTFGNKVVAQAGEVVSGIRKPRRARTRATDAPSEEEP